jgi:ERCC4-type nuclease
VFVGSESPQPRRLQRREAEEEEEEEEEGDGVGDRARRPTRRQRRRRRQRSESRFVDVAAEVSGEEGGGGEEDEEAEASDADAQGNLAGLVDDSELTPLSGGDAQALFLRAALSPEGATQAEIARLEARAAREYGVSPGHVEEEEEEEEEGEEGEEDAVEDEDEEEGEEEEEDGRTRAPLRPRSLRFDDDDEFDAPIAVTWPPPPPPPPPPHPPPPPPQQSAPRMFASSLFPAAASSSSSAAAAAAAASRAPQLPLKQLSFNVAALRGPAASPQAAAAAKQPQPPPPQQQQQQQQPTLVCAPESPETQMRRVHAALARRDGEGADAALTVVVDPRQLAASQICALLRNKHRITTVARQLAGGGHFVVGAAAVVHRTLRSDLSNSARTEPLKQALAALLALYEDVFVLVQDDQRLTAQWARVAGPQQQLEANLARLAAMPGLRLLHSDDDDQSAFIIRSLAELECARAGGPIRIPEEVRAGRAERELAALLAVRGVTYVAAVNLLVAFRFSLRDVWAAPLATLQRVSGLARVAPRLYEFFRRPFIASRLERFRPAASAAIAAAGE